MTAPLRASAASSDDLIQSAQIDRPSVALVEFDASALAQNVSTGEVFHSFTNPDQPLSLSFIGTGLFVSSNGFLVTAAHLAAPTDNDLKLAILTQLYAEALQTNNCSNCDPDPSNNAAANADSYTLSSVQKSVTVFTQDLNLASKPTGLTAEVRQSSPVDHNDIAILKVSGRNFPIIHIGDASTTQIGDQVAVIGYPSTAIENVDLASVTSPTTTFGRISNKVQQQGFDRLAADATAEHGNSGGPLINANGDLVGIVSNGPTSTTNFYIPSNAVREVAGKAGVDNSYGQIDKLWRNGLKAYAGKHYDDAAKIFAECITLNKVQVGCSQYQLLAAERHAQNVPESVPAAAKSGGNGLLIGLAIILGAVLVAGVTIALLLRGRRRVQPPVATASQEALPRTATGADGGSSLAGIPPPTRAAEGDGARTAARFCASCGAQVSPTARFCEGCGQPTGQPVA